jgi:hypothetical protein
MRRKIFPFRTSVVKGCVTKGICEDDTKSGTNLMVIAYLVYYLSSSVLYTFMCYECLINSKLLVIIVYKRRCYKGQIKNYVFNVEVGKLFYNSL